MLSPDSTKQAHESLELLQDLRRHPGYIWLMDWVDQMTRMHFDATANEADPTKLAKNVGALHAYKNVRARIEMEITETMRVLKEEDKQL